jgi:branched-chain amino acid transport system ATP-binding protein
VLAKRSQLSILLVEQNTRAALSVASRGYVLANGRIVHSGPAAGLSDAVALRDAFIGRAVNKALTETVHA